MDLISPKALFTTALFIIFIKEGRAALTPSINRIYSLAKQKFRMTMNQEPEVSPLESGDKLKMLSLVNSFEVGTVDKGKKTIAKRNDEPSYTDKLSRRVNVYWTATQLFLDYKVAQRMERRTRKILGISEEEDSDKYPEIVELWNKIHSRNSQKLTANIMTLKGFWVKVGQFLSTRADIMPPEYLSSLSRLQDSLPSKPFDDIEKTLNEELTREELSLIKSIDPTPLATASIAQVHRAVLVNGKEVVIKVQHRGVASLMLQDMENLRTIFELIAKFEEDFDYSPIIREYTNEIRKELDFRTEAKNMDDVRSLMEKANIRVIVPKTIPNLVKERVLVMDFCHGFPVRDIALLDEHNVDRTKLLERICGAWATQMHVGGVFNADPHMGNILVSTKGEVDGDTSVPVLLDFGLTKRFEPHMKIAFARMMHALEETDVDSLLQSFEEMGMRLNRYDPFEDMASLQSSFKDPAPQSEIKEVSKSKKVERERIKEAKREDSGLKKGQKLRNPVDAWPDELIMFGRVTGMLRGLCTVLNVQYPYLATMAKAARQTLCEEVMLRENIMQNNDLPSNSIKTKLQRKLVEVMKKCENVDDKLGLQLCVFSKGKVAANIASGVMGKADPRPVTPSTLFCIFSVSKAVLSVGILRLIEERLIDIDDPIAKHWPAFGKNGKEKITVKHALTHQSGLAHVFPEKVTIDTLLDWSHMKKVVENAQPRHAPGEDTQYHALSFAWIVGGIIEAVTGRPYEEYLNDIMEPLNLKDMYMAGLPKDFDGRVASLSAKLPTKKKANITDSSSEEEKTQYRLSKHRGVEQLMNPLVFNMKMVQEAKLPSANGITSAFALASLFDAVIDTGRKNALLSSATLKIACTKQPSTKQKERINEMIEHFKNNRGSLSPEKISDMREAVAQKILVKPDSNIDAAGYSTYGIGVKVYDVVLRYGKTAAVIGHEGFGGSIVFAIPELKLSVAFVTNLLTISSDTKNQLLKVVMEEFGVKPRRGLKRYFFEKS